MFRTVGTIKFIIGNDVWINPDLRYLFVSPKANDNLIILDNNEDYRIKMKSVSKEFKLNANQEDINILKHLGGYRQLEFDIDDNLTDIKAVYYSDLGAK
jgi:hypothetical protein